MVAVRLDVTRRDQVEALARELTDVSLVGNNAGIGGSGPVLAPKSIDTLHQQFQTKAVGPLRMVQAFAPTLAACGGSAIVNVISALSWVRCPA